MMQSTRVFEFVPKILHLFFVICRDIGGQGDWWTIGTVFGIIRGKAGFILGCRMCD